MPFRSLTSIETDRFAGAITTLTAATPEPVFAYHNWREPFAVRTSYDNEITFGTYQADEQFVTQQVRPSRTLEASYLEGERLGPYLEQFLGSTSPRTNQTFVNQADYLRNGLDVAWQMPLECDAAKVTVWNGGNLLTGDFSNRRFFPTAKVFVAPPGRQLVEFSGQEFPGFLAIITSVNDTTMQLSAPFNLDVGWTVMPAVDCIPLLEQEIEYQTSKVLEAEVQGVEFPGASALPPSIAKGEVPPGMTTFRDTTNIPRIVFAPDQNWRDGMEVALLRSGQQGFIPRLAGGKPYWGVSAESLTLDRSDWYQILQVFDSTSGGGQTVWFIDPRVIAKNPARGAGNNSIVLPPQGNLGEFIEQTPAIAYQLDDGTWHISELGTPSPDDWDIPVLNPLLGSGALGCVHRAFVARFSGAGLDERWISWDLCEVSFEMVQSDGLFPTELQVP